MSLKTFHLIFIICAIGLLGYVGFWGIAHFIEHDQLGKLFWGLFSLSLIPFLFVFEINFLRATKEYGIR